MYFMASSSSAWSPSETNGAAGRGHLPFRAAWAARAPRDRAFRRAGRGRRPRPRSPRGGPRRGRPPSAMPPAASTGKPRRARDRGEELEVRAGERAVAVDRGAEDARDAGRARSVRPPRRPAARSRASSRDCDPAVADVERDDEPLAERVDAARSSAPARRTPPCRRRRGGARGEQALRVGERADAAGGLDARGPRRLRRSAPIRRRAGPARCARRRGRRRGSARRRRRRSAATSSSGRARSHDARRSRPAGGARPPRRARRPRGSLAML